MSRVTSLLVRSHKQNKNHYQNSTRVGVQFGRDGHHQMKEGNPICFTNAGTEFHMM